jgi:hypothetical protein
MEEAYKLAAEIVATEADCLENLEKIAAHPHLGMEYLAKQIATDRQRAAILRQQLRDITSPAEYRAAMIAAVRKEREAGTGCPI